MTRIIIVIFIMYFAFMTVYWITGGTHKDAINDAKDILKSIKEFIRGNQ